MHRFDIVDPRTLWKSYLLALSLLFVLITSSHFAAAVFGGDGARAAEDINMSGRQRMLSQRILYYSATYKKNGFADLDAMQNLEDAVALFIGSHETLVSESERPLPPELHAIYFGEGGPQLDATVRQFAQATRSVLSGTDEERLSAFFYMRNVGPGPLLRDLNAAVSAFESNARTQVHRAEMWGYIGFGLALTALLLEAFLIFRPAHKSIVKALDTLEENNEQLKQQEAEAFAALEDAEDAWIEAEQARKTSEMLLENTQQKAASLRQEFQVFMGASRNLAARLDNQVPDDTRKNHTAHVQRLLAVCHELVREHTDGYASGAQETREKDISLSLQDVMESVLATLSHYQGPTPIWAEAERDLSTEPKILGQPAALLRAAIGTVIVASSQSGAANAKLDFVLEREGDVPICTFHLTMEGGQFNKERPWQVFASAVGTALNDLWHPPANGDMRPAEIQARDDTGFEIRATFPVKLHAKRALKPSKPVRSARKQSSQ